MHPQRAQEAQATGRVVPSRGADADYDAACDLVSAAESDLGDYLKTVRAKLQCREIAYVAQNKESHVLEVPEAAVGRVPSSFSLVRVSAGLVGSVVGSHFSKHEPTDKVPVPVPHPTPSK